MMNERIKRERERERHRKKGGRKGGEGGTHFRRREVEVSELKM